MATDEKKSGVFIAEDIEVIESKYSICPPPCGGLVKDGRCNKISCPNGKN